MTSAALNRGIWQLPVEAQVQVLFSVLDDIVAGQDATLAALQERAEEVGVKLLVVGGVAVIRHGYERATVDRDVLIGQHDIADLVDHLMDHEDWERFEDRRYCFLYRPTAVLVDFHISGNPIQFGQAYLFPEIDDIEAIEAVAGIPVIGLNDLLLLKLSAGRMRDLADVMQLIKLHLGEHELDDVLAPLPANDERRGQFLEIRKKAPIEIANEQRLGQGILNHKRKRPAKS